MNRPYDRSMGELLLASQNPGKLAEMRKLVVGLPFHVVGPQEIGIAEAPEETGPHLPRERDPQGPLLRRAGRACSRWPTTPASPWTPSTAGPGSIRAASAGKGPATPTATACSSRSCAACREDKRGARFTSAVAVVRGGDVLFDAQEDVEGLIAEETRGPNGFGYDPLFFYPPFGRTFGETRPEDKDRVSHRGKAFARLRKFLESHPA